ncbi:hypothetical protein DFH06DRAFT_1415750 [Mycena polygramma]|nr:hypothetical protein DFH06DRAFT_1415750 [Mycena polygramma]
MSQSTPAPIRDAPAPFDGQSARCPPDFIIRSGDGVDFHVLQAFMREFADLFADLKPPPSGQPAVLQPDLLRDGKPVLVLPEPAAVWFRLLSLAHPARPETLSQYSLGAHNLDGVAAVHEAADKYGFENVQKLLEDMLASPDLLSKHPHRVFAIARLRGLDAVARTAALYTLRLPVCPPDLVIPELDLLPGAAFQRLHEFHHKCGREAERLVRAHLGPEDLTMMDPAIVSAENGTMNFVWWLQGAPNFNLHSTECMPAGDSGYQGSHLTIVPSPWFRNHVEGLARNVRVIPLRETVAAGVLADADRAMIQGCPGCSEDAEYQLLAFRSELELRIQASNNEIAAAL